MLDRHRRLNRSYKHPEGQSLVEFALFVPILALLLSGIAAFGFLLYAHVQVTNATREAARAGSLFLHTRFTYTSCLLGSSACPTGYGDGGTNPGCWTLSQWVENGLVELNRQSNGCPSSGYSSTSNSFGLLSSSKCPSATSGSDCWWVEELAFTPPPPATSPVTAIDATTDVTTVAAHVGDSLRVGLVYRFNVPFIGSVFNTNPIAIRKTVVMRMQPK